MAKKKVKKSTKAKKPSCILIDETINHLGDYQNAIFNNVAGAAKNYWFRGHANISWDLVPAALRYFNEIDRNKAINLLSDLKRYGAMKIENPPSGNEYLKWLQIAQHYGLPTRLLDWTQNMSVALFFACQESKDEKGNLCDGVVYILEPIKLNTKSIGSSKILDANDDSHVIEPYVNLCGKKNRSGLKTIAINPVWNSARIEIQRGVFTLHGSCQFELNGKQSPGLKYVLINKSVKKQLLVELERNGVHDMAIFPELEYTCKYLKWANDLL